MGRTTTGVDPAELESKVKDMYRAVAEAPDGSYHFEMGRHLAEGLGYPASALDVVPREAVESFAGVGYFFDLAQLADGEDVLDLGSGSGMDSFIAANSIGADGSVVGVDMTPEQLDKAERVRSQHGFTQVRFTEGRIEQLSFTDASFDVVISNGVINLSQGKDRVFAEAARVLRPGGRLALADIVTETQLTPKIKCNADLWASCIGGAAQHDAYQGSIEAAGLQIELMHKNPYRFISDQARRASQTFGVMSVSLLARKPH